MQHLTCETVLETAFRNKSDSFEETLLVHLILKHSNWLQKFKPHGYHSIRHIVLGAQSSEPACLSVPACFNYPLVLCSVEILPSVLCWATWINCCSPSLCTELPVGTQCLVKFLGPQVSSSYPVVLPQVPRLCLGSQESKVNIVEAWACWVCGWGHIQILLHPRFGSNT